MARKTITSVGVEFDMLGLRAARVTTVLQGRETEVKVEELEETTGDYSKDEALAAALKAAGEELSVKPKDRVVVSLSGKQVYISQIKFKEMPDAEMKNALRFEIRKNLPFDAAGAVLDYQVAEGSDPDKKGKSTVTVTAVASALLDRTLRLLEKAALKPWIVDVLPLALANAFWAGRPAEDPDMAHAIVHFAPDVCNVVIDGESAPFYMRSIYFSAEEIFGAAAKELAAREKTRRLEALGDELRRSLSYYEKTYNVSRYGWLCLAGNYAQHEELAGQVRDKVGLPVDETPLLTRINSRVQAPPGKFDLALALALRGGESPENGRKRR
jgi:Tfp pilus assembly PilM family ATPase